MSARLQHELRDGLAKSFAKHRRAWAQEIVDRRIRIADLVHLLHAEEKTAQRFTWLIGDLLVIDPKVVEPVVPLLFSLRDQMSFTGMRRTVARCLWQARIPDEIESDAIEQLFDWLGNDEIDIACKHYSCKALVELASDGRVSAEKLKRIVANQTRHSNPAYACRMSKLATQIAEL